MKRLVLAVIALLLVAPIARAHGDAGTLELVETEQVSADSVRYVVRLTYENDGEPVPNKDVTVATDDIAPQVMTYDADGRYAATVTFPEPGEHAVTFAVAEPEATLEHTQVIDAPQAATTTSTTDDTVSNIAGAPLPDEDSEAKGNGWWKVLVPVLAVVIATLAVAFVRGRKPATTSESTSTGSST